MYGIELGKLCVVCGKDVPKGKRGPKRETCSNACRQARHRKKNGQFSWKHKQEVKLILRRRERPFVERNFSKEMHEPLRTLSYRRYVYECLACGTPYVVDRIRSGAPISSYCSPACREKTDYHWRKFDDAMAREHLYRTRIDPKVLERLAFTKLSPLCPHCGKPFAPNTTLWGQRKRGRPRKYCSDYCRKATYEHRWKVRTERARGHRFGNCAECGERFDRTDSIGRRQKRYCSTICAKRFVQRACRIRGKARQQGQTEFKFRRSGFGAAARGATKHRKGGSGKPVTEAAG